MAGDNELSIEETNKLRISLGLKPLRAEPAADSTDESKSTEEPLRDEDTAEGRERIAVDNWKKHVEASEKEAARKRRTEEIKKAREAAQRFRQLEGKGLADDDDEGDAGVDAATWVKKMKKRQKKLAEKMAREKEEELERLAKEQREYTAADLKGVKVAHDVDEFGDINGDTILTLKDATIDENEEEGDELISADLAERERLQERLELKKKKPAYNPNEEADPTGEKKLLAQYDDADEERKKKRFVLDGTGSLATNETYRQEVAEKLKAQAISLDIPKPEVPSDYVDPSKMKIRKPKKTKKKSTRRRAENDEDALNPVKTEDSPDADGGSGDPSAMELDDAPVRAAPKRRLADDATFIDDDDLQAALAMQRRNALKKRKILTPAEIAKQLKESENTPEPVKQEDEDEPGLVIDETSEFVATLRAPTVEDRKPKRTATPTAASSPAETAPTAMAESDDEDKDIDMIRDERSPSRARSTSAGPPAITTTGLEEEATITRGIGATLAMLNQRGLLKRDPAAEEKARLTRERDRFRLEKKLAAIQAEEKAKAARARDRQSGKFERMSAREREEHARWENKQRDQQEARDMAARFKDYKPDVELHYKDEYGREMNQKEAFKYLSHQFHGKGSGKAKTEKRLKKIEDEKKREAASTLSAAGGEDAVRSAARKSKQAGVRLM